MKRTSEEWYELFKNEPGFIMAASSPVEIWVQLDPNDPRIENESSDDVRFLREDLAETNPEADTDDKRLEVLKAEATGWSEGNPLYELMIAKTEELGVDGVNFPEMRREYSGGVIFWGFDLTGVVK